MLQKKYRLTKHGSFAYLYSRGDKRKEDLLRLAFVRSKNGIKIGFSVSNKIGKAVVRNKVKRRMRAVVEKIIPSLYPCQAVFIAAIGIDELSYNEISERIYSLLNKANLIKNA